MTQDKVARRPRASQQQDVDLEGAAIFERVMSKIKWRNNPRSGSKDFGIDGSVTLFRDQENLGIEFLYQLKSSSSVKTNTDGTISCSGIKKSTMRLFKEAQPTPLIVVVDITNEAVYWDFAYDAVHELEKTPTARKKPSATVTLRIKPKQFDSTGCAVIADTLTKMADAAMRPIILSMQPPEVVLVRLDPNADAKEIRADLQDAVHIANAGDHSRAMEKSLVLLGKATLDADRIRVLKILSKCSYELRSMEEAVKYARQGAELQDPGLCANLVVMLARNKKISEAASSLNQFPRKVRESPSVICSEALLAMLAEKRDEALKLFERANKKDPNYADAKLNRAFLWRDRGEYSKAKKLLKQVFSRDQANFFARVSFGSILLSEYEQTLDGSKLGQAFKIFSEVLAQFKLHPPVDLNNKDTQAMALMGLSAVENRRGKMSAALVHLKRVAELGYKWPQLFFNLAQCEMATENPEAARSNFLKALKAVPDDSMVSQRDMSDYWRFLAKAYLDLFAKSQKKKFAGKAVFAYRVSMRRGSKFSLTFVNLGVALLAAGNADEAEKLADERRGSLGSHYLKALCYQAKNDAVGMLRELELELPLEPDGFEINSLLGNYWFRAAQLEKARGYLETAMKKPNWYLNVAAPELVYILIKCYHSTKGIAETTRFFKKIPEFLQSNKRVIAAFA
jgi:tetratricopeptide (TPR) repeat protein